MQMFWLIGGIVLGIAVGAGAALAVRRAVRRLRHRRAVTREQLLRIAAALPLRDVALETFPTIGIRGNLHGYVVSFDGVPKGAQWLWRLHAHLERPWEGRLLLHGDDRPGRMKEVYGTHLVLTGDAAFDRHMIAMASDAERAGRILSTYVRAVLLELPHSHVQMEFAKERAYAECLTPPDGHHTLAAVIEAFILICAASDMAVGSL